MQNSVDIDCKLYAVTY